jgi:hypothetical protein
MGAIGTIPAQSAQVTVLQDALEPRAVANGAARSVADAALERLRWAEELAAIEAEDVLAQADEALSLG